MGIVGTYDVPGKRYSAFQGANMTDKKWENQWLLDHRLQKELKGHPLSYRKYGLTVEQQKQLLEKQDGRCAICNARFDSRGPNRSRSRAFDHDPRTQRIRGFVCRTCYNKMKAFRDTYFFLRVEKYFEKPPAAEFYGPDSLCGKV